MLLETADLRVANSAQDAEPVVTDTYTIIPKDSTCNNLNGPAPSLMSALSTQAPAMSPAASGSTAAAASG